MTLSAEEVVLLCGGAVIVTVLFVFLRRSPVSSPTLVAASLLASVLASAPFTARDVFNDARAARDSTAFAADRVGPESNGIDTTVIDRVARLIPRHATYALVFAPGLDPGITGVFRAWALPVLLPRVAVARTADPEWVVSFAAPPGQLGVSARSVHLIRSARSPRLDAWVGVVR